MAAAARVRSLVCSHSVGATGLAQGSVACSAGRDSAAPSGGRARRLHSGRPGGRGSCRAGRRPGGQGTRRRLPGRCRASAAVRSRRGRAAGGHRRPGGAGRRFRGGRVGLPGAGRRGPRGWSGTLAAPRRRCLRPRTRPWLRSLARRCGGRCCGRAPDGELQFDRRAAAVLRDVREVVAAVHAEAAADDPVGMGGAAGEAFHGVPGVDEVRPVGEAPSQGGEAPRPRQRQVADVLAPSGSGSGSARCRRSVEASRGCGRAPGAR